MYLIKIDMCLTIFILTSSIDVFCLKFLSKEQYNTTLQVPTTTGIVQGNERRTNQNVTYFSYEGIPFAVPPLGNLRFRAPQPLTTWKGVLDASTNASICIQTLIRYKYVKIVGAEDCLYLNIYTPINLKLHQKSAPVIFWIHGGAFIEGTGSYYTSDILINNELIVVTINYRLGALGFLSTRDANSPGNYGLKDQNAALSWIHKNILQFGGDPSKITISGHSSGSSSVLYHLISPKSKGLFSRAIAWSGDTTSPWSYQMRPKKIAIELAVNLGINTVNVTEMIEAMRKVNVHDLLTAQINVFFVNILGLFRDGISFTPTVEFEDNDAFITESFYDAIKNKRLAPVPVMIGIATMEAGLFGTVFSMIRPLYMLFDISPSLIPNGKHNMSFLENRRNGMKILRKYFKSESMLTSTDTELISYFTDLIFTKPIMDTLRVLASVSPVYCFVSGYYEPITRMLFEKIEDITIQSTLSGPVHGEDLLLIWNYKHLGIPVNSTSLGILFARMWFNFASTGNPTPTTDPILDTPAWPTANDPSNISYLRIGDNLKIAQNFKKDTMEFWDELTTF